MGEACGDGRGVGTRRRQAHVKARSGGEAGQQVSRRQGAEDPKREKSQLGRNSETAGTYPYPGGVQAALCLPWAASYCLLVSSVTNHRDCPAHSFQPKHMIG